ncbi:hypothetical protein LKL95_20195 [Bacillus cereus]|uniref:O-antigen ligase family protein n=1 Tax=Bacillus cereus TaxID=1396 RepID=UPI0007ABDF0E|nr:hypothetical protein [Bacillus cereus]MCC2396108.1 hypothetical protein [Bacillus cereus]MCU5657788.1 hypothetical protein [Bacillus cereus]MCU5719668.1 hypothetical protein [Bacillus cereus]
MGILINNTKIEKKANKKLDFVLVLFFFFATIYGTMAIFVENMYVRAIKDFWLGILVAYVLYKLVFSYKINRLIFKLGTVYLIIFIVSVLSLFFADNTLINWIYGIKITLLPIGMLFVGYYHCNSNGDRLIKILSILYAMVLFTWVIQYFMGLDKLLAFGYEYAVNVKNFGDKLRLPSLLGTPDSYALYIAIVSLVIQNSNFLNKRYKIKIFLIITTFLFLFLSTIRTALLLWLMAQGLTAVISVLKNKKRTFLLKCAIFFMFLPMAIIVAFLKMKDTGILSVYSLTDRFTHWGLFNQPLFSSEGIIGKGLGNVGAASVRLEETGTSNWHYGVDNQFLAIYQQMGIVGVILFGAFFFIILLNLLNSLKKSEDKEYRIYALTFSMVLGTLASCVFTNTLELYPFNIIFWFYTGAALKGYSANGLK